MKSKYIRVAQQGYFTEDIKSEKVILPFMENERKKEEQSLNPFSKDEPYNFTNKKEYKKICKEGG